jgi:hypothetical protein
VSFWLRVHGPGAEPGEGLSFFRWHWVFDVGCVRDYGNTCCTGTNVLASWYKKYKYLGGVLCLSMTWGLRCCRCSRLWYSVYLLFWYKSTHKSTNTDAARRITDIRRGTRHNLVSTQFTCFTGTKVQILTLRAASQTYEGAYDIIYPVQDSSGSYTWIFFQEQCF